MAEDGVLIIDDIDASCQLLSPLGNEIVQPAAARLREVVYDLARKRAWSVVRHESFSEWVNAQDEISDGVCVVLDPLVPELKSAEVCIPLRLRREEHGQISALDWSPVELSEHTRAHGVALVDDAASSGRTMREALRLIEEAGASVHFVALCAASAGAQDALKRERRSVCVRTYIRGDWRVIHLRDGCALLPWTGRSAAVGGSALTAGLPIMLRAPQWSVVGNVWQVLHMDKAVAATIDANLVEMENVLRSRTGLDLATADLNALLLGSDAALYRTR